MSQIFGFLLVASALALVSPGVQIARAGDEVAATPAPGAAQVTIDPLLANLQKEEQTKQLVLPQPEAATCETGSEDPLAALMAQDRLREIMRRAAAQHAMAGRSSDQGMLLNSRGYNYPKQPKPE
jgi:hypothetical protein